MSLLARIFRFLVFWLLRPYFFRGTLERMRRRQRDGWLPRDVRVERVDAGGVPSVWLLPPGASERVLLYLHGGGFVMCSPGTHGPLASAIARAAGARALVPDYRLAPEHPFPAALDDAVAAYRWLLGQGVRAADIVIGGDSAGGNLTLVTLLALRAAGLPAPAGALCLSPATDLTELEGTAGPQMKAEVLLTAAFCRAAVPWYVGQADAANPLISPLKGDLRGLPPLLLHVGTRELLLDQSVRFAERARAAGVDVTLRIWEGLWHVFQLFTFLPEAKAAIAELGAFARARFDAGMAGRRKAD